MNGGTGNKPMNRLIHGDCLNEMDNLIRQGIKVDMVLCDLPYGITQNKKDIALPFNKLWALYERITKENAAIVLTASNGFFIDLVNSNRKLYRYDLVWDKVLTSGFLNANRQPLRQHEQIAVFYRKQPVYNPQFTQGKPLHGKGNAYKSKMLINNNYGNFAAVDDSRKGSTEKYPTSIICFPKSHPSKALHPTEKPLELFSWLIRTYTNPGELVLDNCMGSGTTGIACKILNRNFIGIEIDEKHFRIAEKRINEGQESCERGKYPQWSIPNFRKKASQ